jgi:hypothetical protein
MFERMEEAQPDGIVAYVNSNIHILEFDSLHDLLLTFNAMKLEIRRPNKLLGEFEATGVMSRDWFAAINRKDVSKDGNVTTHAVGGYDF